VQVDPEDSPDEGEEPDDSESKDDTAEGARKHFELDDDDLDVLVQTARDGDGEGRALEILWVDKILGGSGIIEAMVREFQQVAGAAARHLDGRDCPASCYRCLRNYRNQRVHGILNWRIAMPYLQTAAASELESQNTVTQPTSEGGQTGMKRKRKVASRRWNCDFLGQFVPQGCPSRLSSTKCTAQGDA
jgi:Domain of unknown function (DUF1998)